MNIYDILTDLEKQRIEKWRKEHSKRCSPFYYFEIHPNELGYETYIACKKCGERKDITDMSKY